MLVGHTNVAESVIGAALVEDSIKANKHKTKHDV